MANPNEFSQPASYLNGGPFETTWGPYATKEEACLALKNEVDADGKNRRMGKKVAIGTATDYEEHAWIGGFEDADLKPILGDFATKQETETAINAIQEYSSDSLAFAWSDLTRKLAMYINKAGITHIVKPSFPDKTLEGNSIKDNSLAREKLAQSVQQGLAIITDLPGYKWVLQGPNKRYAIAVKDDGTVVIPKLSSPGIIGNIVDGAVSFSKLDLFLKTLKRWNGKKCLCIGDSVTAALLYQTIVAEVTGMTVSTHAKGGIGLIQMVDGDGAATNPILPLTAAQIADKDIITIFGSLNDRASLVGTKTDMYPAKTTIYAKLNYVINKIYTLAVSVNRRDIRIVFITPHKVGKYSYINADGGQEFPVGSGQTLEDISNAIVSAAGFYGLPVIDLYHNSGINNFNWEIFTVNTTGGGPFPENKDNVHPNSAGHAQIGRLIGNFINKL